MLAFTSCGAHQKENLKSTGKDSVREGAIVNKSPVSVGEPAREEQRYISEKYGNPSLESQSERKFESSPLHSTIKKISSEAGKESTSRVKRKEPVSAKSSAVPDVVLNFDNADIYEVLNVFRNAHYYCIFVDRDIFKLQLKVIY